MNMKKVIKHFFATLKEDLANKSSVDIDWLILGFLNVKTGESISGCFSGIKAESFDEGIFYKPDEDKYFYRGEAPYDKFESGIIGFEITESLLILIPDGLKKWLNTVATTQRPDKVKLYHSDFKLLKA
jgi:hypothetical protein